MNSLTLKRVFHFWPWWLLLVLSIWLHFAGLGERSFHHDESIHAKLSYDMAQGGGYHYNPTYHGPLLYMLTALDFRILPDNDFTARLPIALCGISLVLLAFFLRRPLGVRAAWWTGLLFTISPTMLFFGRFLRMDLLELTTASFAFLAAWRAFRGSFVAWGWLGFFSGLAFATKENAYVTVAITGMAAAFVAFDRGPLRSFQEGLALIRREWAGILLAVGIFLLVTIPLYTVGLSHPEDWAFPVKAISYWWQQHSIKRVPGPWWFYIPRLVEYEFLVLTAAAVWIFRRGRRLLSLELFLFFFGLSSIVMYIYLGEKVPWLLVHQSWAFIPLAGCQLARSFGPQGRWWSRSLAGLGLALTILVSFSANFLLQEMDPQRDRVSSLHFVQTTPEFLRVAREGLIATKVPGETTIYAAGESVWPLNWYWRHQKVSWTRPTGPVEAGLVICNPEDEQTVATALGAAWESEIVPLRSWWLMYVGEPSASDWFRYMLSRRYWGEIGSTEVAVFRPCSVEVPPGGPDG